MANYINHINIAENDYLIKDTTHPDIKFYYPTGTAAKTTTPFYCARYDVTDADVTEYKDGMMVWLQVPVAGNGSYGTGLQINSLGYKPIVYNVNSMISTRYGVGSRIWCIYNSTQTATLYVNSASAQTVTGCWQVMDYTVSTNATSIIDQYFRPYAGATTYRYKLLVEGTDHRLYPIVTTNQEDATQVNKIPLTTGFKPWNIWYYATTTTIATGAVFAASTIYPAGALANTCQYTFNESVPTYSWVYFVGDYNVDTDLFTLDDSKTGSTYTGYYKFVTQGTEIASAGFTTGKYYLLVGASYSSANYMSLFSVNPLYYYDGTTLIPIYTKIAKESGGGSEVIIRTWSN